VVRAVLLAGLLAACAARTAHAAAPHYLIESEFDPPRAYVGAEVTLRLRLLRAPGVPYGVLRPPRLGEDVDLTPLGRLRNHEARRAGVLYEVREQTYAVVPRREGKLVLPGPEIVGPLLHAPAIVREVRGKPRELEVRPPRVAPGEAWLPARSLTLEESWSQDPGALSAGAPVVRTLLVRAEGITGNRLPRLSMAAQPGLALHPDTGNFRSAYLEAGMGGWRTQRVVLIALDEGELELPALSVSWWDIVADAPRVATLPARKLRVGPAVAPEAPAAASSRAVMRWFSVALFALCALGLWVLTRRQPQRDARRRLRSACALGDAAAAREALADWWKAETRRESAPLPSGMGEAWDAAARAQLASLDAALYGGKPWDGRAFWGAVKPWLGKKPRREVRPPAATFFRLQDR